MPNYLNRDSPNTLITGREGTSVSDYLRRKREAELMPQERGELARTDEYGRINIGGDIGWRDVQCLMQEKIPDTKGK